MYDSLALGLTPFLKSEPGYRGVGPKRSDHRIYEDVCQSLQDHPDLDASQMEVEVEGGEVTLKGKVSDKVSKRLAEDLSLEVKGVFDVHNRLTLEKKDLPSILGSASREGVTAVF